MNVASLKLCKELYELSGWNDCYWWHVWDISTEGDAEYQLLDKEDAEEFIGPDCAMTPAYGLEEILQKIQYLPHGSRFKLKLLKPDGSRKRMWAAQFDNHGRQISPFDNTPINAVVELAIELFKQGIIKKGIEDE